MQYSISEYSEVKEKTMPKIRLTIVIFILLSILLSACAPTGINATETEDSTTTSSKETLENANIVTFPPLVGADVDNILSLFESSDVNYTVEYKYLDNVRKGVIVDVNYTGTVSSDGYINIDKAYPVTITASRGMETVVTTTPPETDPPETDPPETTPPEIVPTEAVNVKVGDANTLYLTFDDGPNKYTDQVLDILDKYNVKATFFTVGTFAEYYPARIRRIVESGHTLACHTYDHEFNTVYSSPESMIESIKRWERSVEAALGYLPEYKIFRFPGGSNNGYLPKKDFPTYYNALKAYGYTAFDWTFSNNDRYLNDKPEDMELVEYLKQSAVSTLKICLSKPSMPKIMLMHDTTSPTPEALEWILQYYIKEGYTFGTLDNLDGDWLFRLS